MSFKDFPPTEDLARLRAFHAALLILMRDFRQRIDEIPPEWLPDVEQTKIDTDGALDAFAHIKLPSP